MFDVVNFFVEVIIIVNINETGVLTQCDSEFITDGNKLIIPKEYKGSKIKKIGKGVFADRTDIEFVFIPNTITEIKKGAFSCSSIKNVTFEEKSNIIKIEEYAFSECYGLKSFLISTQNNIQFGCAIFQYSGIEKIDFSNTNIENISPLMFLKSKIKNIILPKSIKSIKTSAFQDSRIEFVNWSELENLSKIEGNAFCNTPIELIDNIFERFIKFGSNSFSKTNVTSVKIDIDKVYLDSSVFEDCKKLKNVEFINTGIKGYFFISNNCFYNCNALSEVILSEGIYLIGENSFADCNLENIIFPSSLGYILQAAFKNNNLKEIDFLKCGYLDIIKNESFKNNKLLIDNLYLPKYVPFNISKRAFDPIIQDVLQENYPFSNINNN